MYRPRYPELARHLWVTPWATMTGFLKGAGWGGQRAWGFDLLAGAEPASSPCGVSSTGSPGAEWFQALQARRGNHADHSDYMDISAEVTVLPGCTHPSSNAPVCPH